MSTTLIEREPMQVLYKETEPHHKEREPQDEKWHRISLDVDETMWENINRLKKLFGRATKASVLRSALALLLLSKEAEAEGAYLALVTKDGQTIRLLNR